MPREACGLNVSEAEPALTREPLEVDDARRRHGVAAALGAEHDRAVVPALERGFQLVRRLRRDERAHDLRAVEADLDAYVVFDCAHGVTNSARTPWTASGWTNATWRPKRPERGSSSMSSAPRSERLRRAVGRSFTS